MHSPITRLCNYALLFSQLTVIHTLALAQPAPLPPTPFSLLGTFRDVGLVLNQVVGPGPAPGTQRLYVSIAHMLGGFDIVAIDPDTAAIQVFHSPISTEIAAWGMAVGPDGNIYLGTTPNAHFIELNVSTGTLMDLGTPSASEISIWQLALGPDNRIYGGTYPDCKLVSFDPANGRLADLGRLDPHQSYARYLAASADGFIYAGIGSAQMNIAAYDITTGATKELLPAQTPAGFAVVYPGVDGHIYGYTSQSNAYVLQQWAATAVPRASLPEPIYHLTLEDGRTVSVSSDGTVLTMKVSSPSSTTPASYVIPYPGEPNLLFRIGLGPDGNIYGSGEIPSELIRFDLSDGISDNLGSLGNGEVYSLLASQGRLFMGSYSDTAVLYSFDPATPFNPNGQVPNPIPLPLADGDSAWRPEAAIENGDGTLCFGVVAGYGQLTGPLLELSPGSDDVKEIDVVPEQSVVSLTSWNGLVIGGTSVLGGDGSTPTQASAVLFGWDTQTDSLEFEVVPVPGATSITDLIMADNGLIYGIADLTLFEFDPSAQRVTRSAKLGLTNLIYNSIGTDELGRIWGLSGSGVFALDTDTLSVKIEGFPPVPISGGFAVNGSVLYFASGASLYSYALPAATPTFNPGPVTGATGETVSMIDATPGATIYYTTDGTVPNTSSLVYSGPIMLSGTETIQAIATAPGYSESLVASATYVTVPPASTPVFNPGSNTYAGTQTVSIGDFTPNATIYYTTDGTTPTTESPVYGNPITVGSTETLQAIAVAPGYSNSAIASADYTILLPPPSFTLSSSPGSVSLDAGSQAAFVLTISPQNGFDSAVGFACSGLPAGATCSFSPTTLTPSGPPVTTTMTIATSTASARLGHRGASPFPVFALAAILTFLWPGKRRRLHLALILLIATGAGLVTGCGSSLNPGPGGADVSPATSTVTITATSGVLQQTATVSLCIND